MSKIEPLKYFSLGIGIILLFFLPVVVSGQYALHILIMIGINVVLTTSLRFILNTGRLSLAHGGMVAIGAYTTAIFSMKLGISPWIALILGGTMTGLVAFLVGCAFVRVRGVYFILMTVFFGEIIRLIMEEWKGLTNGSVGIMNIIPPTPIIIPGILRMNFESKVDFYYLVLVMVLISLLVLYALEHSRLGITWFSVAQSRFLAESVGVNTRKYDIIAFSTGSIFAGLTGGFYSQYISAIYPSVFGFFFMVYIVVYMVAGGQGKFGGPIIGAIILTYLSEAFRGLQTYQPIGFAVILMLIIVFLPDGLVDLPHRIKVVFNRKSHHA